VGVSRVQLDGSPDQDGVYWLVFSDHVHTPDLGAEGGGAFGREAIPCQAP